MRIGSRTPVPIDVRLIAATNVNLEEAVHAGRFREDLYYRINVVPIQLAPLRERPGDIMPLVEHFIAIYKNRLHTPELELHPDTLRLLHEYLWPGNIRELENTIHRALLVCEGNVLLPSHLNLPRLHAAARERLEKDGQGNANDSSLDQEFYKLFELGQEQLYDSVNRKLILQAYEHSRNNQVQTAKLLGISRNELRTQLKQYGIIE